MVDEKKLDENLRELSIVLESAGYPGGATVDNVRRLADDRDRLARALRTLDRRGGLGLDVHAWIGRVLDGDE